jgi:hypothetical protein
MTIGRGKRAWACAVEAAAATAASAPASIEQMTGTIRRAECVVRASAGRRRRE